MLGLRLDVGRRFARPRGSVDDVVLGRLERLGLASRHADRGGRRLSSLTPARRRLGGGVTAELLV